MESPPTDSAIRWSEWFALESVTMGQAIALSLGLDPYTLEKQMWPQRDHVAPPEYHRRLALLEQAPSLMGPVNRWDGGGRPHVDLRRFAAWAMSAGWGMPDELSQLIGRSQAVPKPDGFKLETFEKIKRAYDTLMATHGKAPIEKIAKTARCAESTVQRYIDYVKWSSTQA